MTASKSKIIPAVAFLLSHFAFSFAQAQDYVIALESAGVRTAPQFFAGVQASLPYGTHVKLLKTEGAWVKIEYGSATGWVHKSAFAKAEPILKDIGRGTASVKETYKDEVVTAGKGFSESSESTATASDLSLQYNIIDQLECRKVSGQQMQQFMQDGGLKSQMVGE
jgi:uncharacterized protein YraI